MKTKYLMALWLWLAISATAHAQVITDKPTFINNLMQVFHYRDTRFDSLVVWSTKEAGGFASKLKLPKADECYILNNSYYAGYAFKDNVQAITFFKEVKGLIAEAATAYNAKVRFVPNAANPYYQQFHLGNNELFYAEADLINLLDRSSQKKERPFLVFLIFNGSHPAYAYYTSAGQRIANAEITALVKEIAFGKDSLMLHIKGEKIVGKTGSYKSKRTLKGYTATIYEEIDDEEAKNTLGMNKGWTGKKDDEVFRKADSLILSLKAALPDTYCYLTDNSEQKISFYPHPFNTQTLSETLSETPDALLDIYYGRTEKAPNAYYVSLNISRTANKTQAVKTIVLPVNKVNTKGKSGKKNK